MLRNSDIINNSYKLNLYESCLILSDIHIGKAMGFHFDIQIVYDKLGTNIAKLSVWSMEDLRVSYSLGVIEYQGRSYAPFPYKYRLVSQVFHL